MAIGVSHPLSSSWLLLALAERRHHELGRDKEWKEKEKERTTQMEEIQKNASMADSSLDSQMVNTP